MNLSDKCKCLHPKELHYQVVKGRLNYKGYCKGGIEGGKKKCRCKKFEKKEKST